MIRKPLNENNDEQDPNKPRPTKTKTQDADMEDLFRRAQHRSAGDLEPVKPEEHQQQRKEEPKAPPRPLSREETQRRMSGVRPSEEMMRKLGSIDPTLQDEISDEEARQHAMAHATPTPTDTPGVEPRPPDLQFPLVKPETLPKIVSKELMDAGVVVPEWHMVKSLPGYMASAIRHIGRRVFSPFTRTPLEKIQVIANLMGQGPNTDREVNAVAGYLQKNVPQDRKATLEFTEKIPDYGADIAVYKDKGVTYLLCSDFAGKYIYAWPSDDEYGKLDQQQGKLGHTKESVVSEAKAPPGAKKINDALRQRRGAGHYSKKLDYKRAVEQRLTRKQVNDESK